MSDTKYPQNLKRVRVRQYITVILLFLILIVNFFDRSSLSIANSTIRHDLGLSATEIGLLLSAFSLPYGIAGLGAGPLLDRKGSRLILGLALFVWSIAQLCCGLINTFSQFICARVVLGIGESPMLPAGVKSITDWFNSKERGRPMGFFNSASNIGLAISPPVLVAIMLAFGWRGMFVIIGVLGILIGIAWFMLYRNREELKLLEEEQKFLNEGNKAEAKHPVNLKEWCGLFKNRTMWGMMIGFIAVNYTSWLYISWLPGYLQENFHLNLTSTGWLAAIPFLCGAIGAITNGFVVDWLIKKGVDTSKARRCCIVLGLVISAIFTFLVSEVSTVGGALTLICIAYAFIHFGGTSTWGYIHATVSNRLTATVGSLQNFMSFLFSSIAPVLTGYILDKTGSFSLSLEICAIITIIGALSYAFIVKRPIGDDVNG